MRRKDFLINAGWAAAGLSLGALGARRTAAPPPSAEKEPQGGVTGYAQAGEDLAIAFAAQYLNLPAFTYLDIGAYDPIFINNTYLFYRRGNRGVLVEPNVDMCKVLRRVRPDDTTLEAGIGVSAVREADYYLMTEPSWNTFSKEEAEHQEQVTNGGVRIREVVKMPLLNINDVMEKHFKGAPTFVSIDAEGLHLAIAQSIDYRRFRPTFFCIETLVSGTNETIPAIPAFLESQGYVHRGGSFVNAIFVDSEIL